MEPLAISFRIVLRPGRGRRHDRATETDPANFLVLEIDLPRFQPVRIVPVKDRVMECDPVTDQVMEFDRGTDRQTVYVRATTTGRQALVPGIAPALVRPSRGTFPRNGLRVTGLRPAIGRRDKGRPVIVHPVIDHRAPATCPRTVAVTGDAIRIGVGAGRTTTRTGGNGPLPARSPVGS